LHELWYGVVSSGRQSENLDNLRRFLSSGVSILPFEVDDAIRAGELRAALKAKGTPIGSYDLLIAAQALRTSSTLVTADQKEFSRVTDLKVQNWLEKG
jgi:tRNA(fMet)-specific endonuclease VapC